MQPSPNSVVIAEDNWIGPAALITKDTEAGAMYRTEASPNRWSAAGASFAWGRTTEWSHANFYDRQDRSRWDDFVDRSKNGTFLFRRDYMDYHEDRFVDASVIVLDEAEALLALFPANRSGNRIVSHGGLSYGGMVSSEAMITSRAVDIMAAWLASGRQTASRR